MARLGRGRPHRPLIKEAVLPAGPVTVALTGVAATGSVGSLVPSFSKALTGVSATGSVGTLSPGVIVALTGVSGTADVGTLAASISKALTGVLATGSVGTLTPVSGVNIALTGVSATVSVGSLAPSFSIGLTGVSATASVGTFVLAQAEADVIRNFSLREWRKWVKKEEEDQEEVFEELIKEAEIAVKDVVNASQAISRGEPEGPALLKAMEARQRYEDIYRKAFQDAYVDNVVAELWKADMLQMRKRMAIILLLLNS